MAFHRVRSSLKIIALAPQLPYLYRLFKANYCQRVNVQIPITSLSVFQDFSNRSLSLKNKNHDRIIIAMGFINGQTWDRVKTLLDRNASYFQRRAQLRAPDFSVKSVISVFQKPPFRTPKFTETRRNTPKEAAGAGGRELGCAGRSHLVHV